MNNRNRMASVSRLAEIFTPKQGQYWRLSTCTCVCTAGCRLPAEPDMQEYFRVSPPSIPNGVTLEWAGFIPAGNKAHLAASKLLVNPKQLPELI